MRPNFYKTIHCEALSLKHHQEEAENKWPKVIMEKYSKHENNFAARMLYVISSSMLITQENMVLCLCN